MSSHTEPEFVATTVLRIADKDIRLEVANTPAARARGLLGRDSLDGALLITPSNSVHTFGMRFTIDVAYLDRDHRVLDVTTMKPNRVGRPRWRARHIIEAEAGRLVEWGLRAGSVAEVI
ncbi:DUF192 domain-containing protein [Streptomyces sp. SGAir0957]